MIEQTTKKTELDSIALNSGFESPTLRYGWDSAITVEVCRQLLSCISWLVKITIPLASLVQLWNDGTQVPEVMLIMEINSIRTVGWTLMAWSDAMCRVGQQVTDLVSKRLLVHAEGKSESFVSFPDDKD